MNNQDESMKKEDDLVKEKVVSKKVSIGDLAKQIEKGEVNSAMLDKKTKMKCTLFYVTRGYENHEIAEILKVNIRTIQRYCEYNQSENMPVVDEHFQGTIARDFYYGFRLQYKRILRLSYSDDLSDAEKIKAIALLHQLDVNKIAALERLGYISRGHGMAEKQEIINLTRKADIMSEMSYTKKALEETSKALENFKGSEEDKNKLHAQKLNLMQRYIKYSKDFAQME